MTRLSATIFSTAIALTAAPATAGEPSDLFIIRDLSTGTEEAAEAIRSHVEEHDDWLFLAEFPLKGGEIHAMKICYLPLGADIFAAGLHVAAAMPCGNLAFYEEDGQPRLSMLDLRFLTELQDDPNLERAVETGNPAFEELLATALE